MSFRNAFGIYQVLERLLKQSPHPLTSVELFDNEEVRKYAEDVNKVSDYLGHMYRREYLGRQPSRGIGMAKYAYYWKNPKLGSKTPARPVPVQRHAQPRLLVRSTENETRLAAVAKLQQDNNVVFERPTMKITEEGHDVTIELPNLVITIAMK